MARTSGMRMPNASPARAIRLYGRRPERIHETRDTNAAPPTSVPDLDAYIRVAKAKDVPDDALEPLLRRNGWSERHVFLALTDYDETALGVRPGSADRQRHDSVLKRRTREGGRGFG